MKPRGFRRAVLCQVEHLRFDPRHLPVVDSNAGQNTAQPAIGFGLIAFGDLAGERVFVFYLGPGRYAGPNHCASHGCDPDESNCAPADSAGGKRPNNQQAEGLTRDTLCRLEKRRPEWVPQLDYTTGRTGGPHRGERMGRGRLRCPGAACHHARSDRPTEPRSPHRRHVQLNQALVSLPPQPHRQPPLCSAVLPPLPIPYFCMSGRNSRFELSVKTK